MEVEPPDESKLIARARDGDARAYGDLVRMHQDVAHRTAFLITRDAAEAQDAAQTAFIKAFGALVRFQAGRGFRPWLLAIVANEARNRVRSSSRRLSSETRWLTVAGTSHERSPEGEVVDRERADQLVAALERLGDEHRVIVSCRFLLDLSEEETANVLGIARGTVKSRLSRALARLREQLSEEGPDA